MKPERLFLLASAAVAVGIPLLLHRLVDRRLHGEVEPALSQALGAPVTIDEAEADLGGSVVLRGVRVGDVLSADSVSAGVGLSHLLAGVLAADEIEVVRPRLTGRISGGRLDLGLRRGRGASGGVSRPRRIRVRDGEVVLRLPGVGEARAEDVEIHPQEGGVRVVAGRSTATFVYGGFAVDASWARVGIDLELPSLRATRAALDGGTVTLAAPGAPPLVLERALLLHGGDTRLSGEIHGEGPFSVRLEPGADGLRFSARARSLPLAPLAAALPPWLLPAGRVRGEVTGHARGDGLDVEVSLVLDEVTLSHPLVASAPLPVSAAVDGSLAVRPAERAARARLKLTSGPLVLHVAADGAVDAAGALSRLEGTLELERVGCAEALTGLPAALRTPLDGLELSGDVEGRLAVALDAARPDDLRLDIALDAGCAADRVPTAIGDLQGPVAHTFPDGTARTFARGEPGFAPLAELPAHVAAAFIAAEDTRFYEHHGFDPAELRRSLAKNLAQQRVERGGSTISQQVVKNLFLTRDRTLSRKLVEAVLTFVVETRATKQRILELYLNVIELGNGVYGIDAGARRWFGKPARALVAVEAAFLAAITPAPLSVEQRLRGARHLDAATDHRVRVVLGGMRRAIGGEAYRGALEALPRLRILP